MSRFHSLIVEGITLHKTPALQNVGYLSILTKSQGIIEARYRLPQTIKAKLVSNLEPFTRATFELYTRNQTPTLKAISNSKTNHILQITPNQLELLAYITRITRLVFPSEQPIPHCFKAINTIIDQINTTNSTLLLLHFVQQTVYQAGIMPNLKQCSQSKNTLNNPAYYNNKKGELSNYIDSEHDITITLNCRKLIANSNNFELLQKTTIPKTILTEAIIFLSLIIANYLQLPPNKIIPTESLLQK